MKVKIWTLPTNNGDGSASVCIFESQEAAEEYVAISEAEMEDCIYPRDLEFDEYGILLNPDRWDSANDLL